MQPPIFILCCGLYFLSLHIVIVKLHNFQTMLCLALSMIILCELELPFFCGFSSVCGGPLSSLSGHIGMESALVT